MALTDCQSISRISLLNILTCIQESWVYPCFVLFCWWGTRNSCLILFLRVEYSFVQRQRNALFSSQKPHLPVSAKSPDCIPPPAADSQLPPVAAASKLCSLCDKRVRFGDTNLGTYPSESCGMYAVHSAYQTFNSFFLLVILPQSTWGLDYDWFGVTYLSSWVLMV